MNEPSHPASNQNSRAKRVERAASALVKAYLRNEGTEHEFIVTRSGGEKGGDTHKLWTALRDALKDQTR